MKFEADQTELSRTGNKKLNFIHNSNYDARLGEISNNSY